MDGNKKSLKTEYPNIAAQWHPYLNGELTPADVPPRSNRKVWWICAEGHAYQRTVDKQVSRDNSPCPVCNGKRYVLGINDVRTKYPEIAEEWDVEVNDGKRPEEYSFISSEKIVWRCKECGYEWITTIKNRCVRGTTCHNCARRKVWEKRFENMDLGITDPNVLSEWDYELNKRGPESYPPYSNQVVYWHCKKCGYRYKGKISNKANGRGCPCCANKVVVKGVNDLATTHPDVAAEWYQPLNGNVMPYDVTHGCGKKYYWLCPRGHVYAATVLHRTNGVGTNCPVCNSGRQTSYTEQAFFYYIKKVFPDAINRYKDLFERGMELDIFIPSIKIAVEYDGVFWHHRKSATYEREQRKYDICNKNDIKLIRVREQRKHEEENPPADWCLFLPNDKPDDEELNHAIEEVIKQLISWSNGVCTPLPIINVNNDRFEILSYLKGPVKNSVQKVAPAIAAEWDYERNGELKPDMIPSGSSQVVNWVCSTCGYRWEAKIYHRVKNHTGCPKCAGLVFEKGVNDLATKNPELLVDWDYEGNSKNGIYPENIIYNSGTRVKWICHTCGNRWTVSLNARTVQRAGCIKCGYQSSVELKRKKLIEKHGCITDPLLLKEWDYKKNSELGLNPEELPPSSTKYAYWICSTCGYEWKAPIARRIKGAGCRKCADKANPDLKRKKLLNEGRGLSNDLLFKEWNYELNSKEPQEFTSGSDEKVHWICSKCGYKWVAAIYSRNKGAGCPACAGQVVVAGKNDLMFKNPEIAKEWDYEKNILTPEQVTYSSGQKYWWICNEGHASYQASPSHRIRGTGCPICGNRKISEKMGKPVDQLSLEGTYIRTFKSAKEAGAACQVSGGAITNAIRKGTTSAGFRWRHHIKEE